ncbi:MAG: hypothetical protein ACI915_000051 [Gammaproteobacteria bacterium]|jgi:hypothetical protein
MQMNWDALGAIAELVGAIAVVATLFYLAAQIKQNGRMVRSTIREQRFGANQSLLVKMADEAELYTKLEKQEKLTDIELTRASLLIRASFRLWESSEYQYRNRVLEAEEWRGLRESIRNRIGASSYHRQFWADHKSEFSEHFQNCVTELLSQSDTKSSN